MILALLLALQAPSTEGVAVRMSDEAQLASCTAKVKEDAAKAAEAANEWLIRGGGLEARQCLGLAYAAMERWAPAATVYEQAARAAETERDNRRADLWVQGANAWLAAGEPAKARAAVDAALATGLLAPELRGEAHLDRARAGVALGELASARSDIDKGLELVPDDPFAWYLSSALALREDDLAKAKAHADKALALAPTDPDVLVHAGNVAGVSGSVAEARTLFERAIQAAPDSEAGKRAAAALAMNSGEEPTAPPQP